jgi:hypothetical protein
MVANKHEKSWRILKNNIKMDLRKIWRDTGGTRLNKNNTVEVWDFVTRDAHFHHSFICCFMGVKLDPSL